MAQKIFIDTDCGIDDAVAIMMALSSPEVEIAGISCVAGNTSLENVLNNVCGLLNFYKRTDIPVYRGCSTSMLRISHNADKIHGSNGLADVVLDTGGKTPEAINAAEGIFAAAKAYPGIKLITLGPLTNLAFAFNLYPELSELISEIVMMGGAVGPGNVTPWAEFNFFYDPEAAAFSLGTGVPVKILTWDATVAGFMPEEEFLRLDMNGTPAGDLFIEIQSFYLDFMENSTGSRKIGFPDPLTVACVIDPAIAIETENMSLCMILNRENEKRGASVVVSDSDGADGTADVILKCDMKRFSELAKRIKINSPK
ncbi:MAG: nucleoside hydrolase [Spirochaetales bacterium]|uniref:Nucleoside hydrolase n=1 Tax=Candidatus Thalassospirochaeta sargassi TaxID=3119039 RepID=A0AAJ1IH98_9SPIO|nr:nucleoside hydrolase [Spirochaetales bacterium]